MLLLGQNVFLQYIFLLFDLVFIPAKKYIKYFSDTTLIDSWKSNGMLGENIENMTKSDSNFAATFVEYHTLLDINFHRSCLTNISVPKKVIHLYISYTPSPWLRNLNRDFTWKHYLLGSVKVTKNDDPDKYKYNGYGIGWFLFRIFIYRWKYGKKTLFLELIWAHLCILIIKTKIS